LDTIFDFWHDLLKKSILLKWLILLINYLKLIEVTYHDEMKIKI